MKEKAPKRFARFVKTPAVFLAAVLSTSCFGTDAPTETRYYFGDVYDGVTGAHLTKYNIDVEYFGRRQHGALDADGGFSLPGVPADNDFTVYIDAPNYRPFVSHQAQFLDVVHADRSYHYEAYLFATSAVVADVPVTITLSDSTKLPSGSIRFRPTNHSALDDDPDETPSGIPGQVWTNDEDLLSDTVTTDFTAGAATIPGKSLVYGVPYQISVLNVPGYQLQQLDNTPFEAGVDGRSAFVLAPLATAPLAVSYVSTSAGQPSPDGTLTIVFNQPVEFDPLSDQGAMREAVDDAFSIDSENTNGNAVENVLNDNVDPNLQERGTSIALNGEQFVLSWDETRGLKTIDTGDRISSVTYGGLDDVHIRPQGGNAASSVSLSALLGSTTETVIISP